MPACWCPKSAPLQGQSKHVANASLLYKNPRQGFDVQLAYVYTGARIVQVGQYLGLDYWQRAQSQLDFSAEKRLTKPEKPFGLTAYVKIQNLLNTPYQVDILAPGAPAAAGAPATVSLPLPGPGRPGIGNKPDVPGLLPGGAALSVLACCTVARTFSPRVPNSTTRGLKVRATCPYYLCALSYLPPCS